MAIPSECDRCQCVKDDRSQQASLSPMLLALSIVASLSPATRQDIGLQVLSRSQLISYIATRYWVSRKFIYQHGDKAQQALDESFAPS